MVTQLDEQIVDWSRRMLAVLGLGAPTGTTSQSSNGAGTNSPAIMMFVAETQDADVGGAGPLAFSGVSAAPDATKPKPAAKPKRKVFRYNIKITPNMKGMSAEAFLTLALATHLKKQPNDPIVLQAAKKWKYTVPFKSITEEDVKRGYVPIEMGDFSDDAEPTNPVDELQRAMDEYARLFHDSRLSDADRKLIDAYKDKLTTGKDDKIIPEWLTIGLELVKQRLAIADLDQEMFRFIATHSNTALPLSPELYGKVLEVAEEFDNLKRQKSTWQDFSNQMPSSFKNLDDMKTAVKVFGIHLSHKKTVASIREDAKEPLAGKKKLYDKYKELQALQKKMVELAASVLADPTNTFKAKEKQAQYEIQGKRLASELEQLLKDYGYTDVYGSADFSKFKAEMDKYVTAFEKEAVVVAGDLLNRGERQLVVHEQALTDENLKALFKNLGKARTALANLPEPDAKQMAAKLQFGREMYLSTRTEDLKPVVAAVNALVDSDPLLQDLKGRGGFPFTLVLHVDLAEASNERALREVLLGSITSQRDGIQKTRKNLQNDPKLVWKFDKLLDQAKKVSHADEDPMLNGIVQDKLDEKAEEAKWEMIKEIGIALALGLATFGTGTVAVIGGMAAVGYGFNSGMDSLRQYQIESAAHGANLLSKEPSLAWVVIAFVSLAPDVLGIKAVAKGMAQAAKAQRINELLKQGSPLGDAVRTFNAADDQLAELTKLESKLGQLQDVDANLTKTVLKAAHREAEKDAAWQAAKMSGGKLRVAFDPLITPIAQMVSEFVYPALLSLRQRLFGLDQFVKNRRVKVLIKDINELSNDALTNVKLAHKEAMKRAEDIAKKADELKLSDDAFDKAIEAWGRNANMNADEFIDSLSRYKPAGDAVPVTPTSRAPTTGPTGTPGKKPPTSSPSKAENSKLNVESEKVTDTMLEKEFAEVVSRVMQKGKAGVTLNEFVKMPEVVALIGKAEGRSAAAAKKVADAFEKSKASSTTILTEAKRLNLGDDVIRRAMKLSGASGTKMSPDQILALAKRIKEFKLDDNTIASAITVWRGRSSLAAPDVLAMASNIQKLKLDDKAISQMMMVWKGAPKLSQAEVLDMAAKIRAKGLKLDENSIKSALSVLDHRPKMSADEFVDVAARIQKDKLGENAIKGALKVWAAKPDMSPYMYLDVASKLQKGKVSKEYVDTAISFWQHKPQMTQDEFINAAVKIQRQNVDENAIESALKLSKIQPNLDVETLLDAASLVKKLRLNEESIERALVKWEITVPKPSFKEFMEKLSENSRIVLAQNPVTKKMNISSEALAAQFSEPAFDYFRRSTKPSLDKFLERPDVVALLGKNPKLDGEIRKFVEEAYAKAMRDADDFVKRVNDVQPALKEAEIAKAFALRRTNPTMPVDELIKKIPRKRPDYVIPPNELPPAHNPNRKGPVSATKAGVMDAGSAKVLNDVGAPKNTREIAGTGAIQKIDVALEPGADGARGAYTTSIKTEILPDRMQRDLNAKLEDWQSHAPNFNRDSALPKLNDLGLDSKEWSRLHLAGPGFGDEAAAGMHIGSDAFNQMYQRLGIERLFREFADAFAPFRSQGYKVEGLLKSTSWGRTTPGGKSLSGGEQFLKRVEYEVIITRPNGPPRRARISIESKTDPADLLKADVTKRPKEEIIILLDGEPFRGNTLTRDSFRLLFDSLPAAT